MGARGPLGTDRQQDWTQHNSSVPQEHCLARGGAGDLEWPEAAARWRGGTASTPCLAPQVRWGWPQTIPALRGCSPQPICSSMSLWQTKTTLANSEPCQDGGDKPAFVSEKAKLALGKRLDSEMTGVCALAAFHLEVSNPCADDSKSLKRSLPLAWPTHETCCGSHRRSSLVEALSTGPQTHTHSNRKTEPRGV